VKKIILTEKYYAESLSVEDSGRAMIIDIVGEERKNDDFFVRLHSWNDDGIHKDMIDLINDAVHNDAKIRVTVEVVD
jgi:hypothetical protein